MGYYQVPHSLLSVASILEFPHVWNFTFMKYYEYPHLYQSALPGINWRWASCCYAHYVTQFWRHHRVPWPDGLFLTTGASVCPWRRASRDPKGPPLYPPLIYLYDIYIYIIYICLYIYTTHEFNVSEQMRDATPLQTHFRQVYLAPGTEIPNVEIS